jgi:thioredoxin 2
MKIVTCAKCGAKNRIDEKAVASRQPVCGKCGAALDTKAGDAGVDTSKPRTITDATFARELQEAGDRPMLVDCWAPWCGPCRMIAPILDKLAAESGGRYIIAKLNVDENPQTSARFGIQSIPTLLIFKNGALVDRMIGVQSREAIAARLK